MGQDATSDSWRQACRQPLVDGLAAGELTVHVVELDGRVVATAAALPQHRLPTVGTPHGAFGWLEQVVTTPSKRAAGHARACVLAVLQWLREAGVTEVQMQATERASRCTASWAVARTHRRGSSARSEPADRLLR